MKGWKHKKTSTIIGTEKTPTKMEAGQVIINKKATKKHLDKLIDINNDGLDNPSTKVSTDGTDGGILKGKPHYDENGNPTGGIPVIVDGGKKIEVEGDEFVVNKEASQKHWKELSKINQSAGNGVPINPSDVGSDEDPEEFRKGGVIEFNPNHLPNHLIYSYAKKVKEKYPKVWDMGGNIFGNEAFKNLERVIKRGYWTENEEWMYIKWRSYVARHHKDFRIAGTIAMLKWLDKTDKGWPYMKALIEKEIAKKYPKKGWKNKMAEGGGVEFIPEKKGTLIRGNEIIKYFEKVNGNYRLIFYTLNESKGKVPTDAFGYCEELDIMNITPKELVELIKKNNLMEYGGGVVTYKNKYNKKYGYDKNESHDLKEIAKDTDVSVKGLQQIYNKGVGAYKTNPQSVRPNVKSKEQWAMARVYSAVMGGKAARVDAKELKMEYGGGVEYSAIQEILNKAKPFQDELTEKYIESVKNEGKITLTDWDIQMYQFGLVMDLTKAIGNYLEKDDLIKDLKFIKDQSSIVISCVVIRDGVEYNFSTEVILAGGYNIQKLHLRYIVHTKLDNKRSNPEYDKLNEQYKKINKAQKIREEISRFERNILYYEIELNKAKANSKLSDEEVEKLSRSEKPDVWKNIDITWEIIIERGADENYNYDKSEFERRTKEKKEFWIQSWKDSNANYKRIENTIKEIQKNISKLNKKLSELEADKMAEGGGVDAKELKMQYGGNTVNNACIEELVSLINSHSEIEYWDVDKNTENLVIVFKNEIGNYDIDIYNQFLNGLAECETVFDKEVEIQYDNSDYKTIFVKLKTSIENGGGKNIEFMKWFVDWYKTINKQININFSVPNILSPFKEDNVIILDLFEKINQDIDAKPYLNKIIEKADDFGVVIYLEPTPRYKYFLENAEKRKKISKDYLIKYYKNFGFELTSNGQFMKRVPKMKNGGIIKDITCTQCGWSWNKSDSEKHDEYVCHKCGTDNEMKYGGELAKGIKAEKEHIDTAKKLYSRKLTPNEAARSIAMEHIKEDPKYYSKMENIDFDNHYNEIKSKYADGGSVEPTYTLRTPTGEKSKLTYLQQVLVRTSSFKKFFGDWETAAKMYLADNKENYKKHFENVSKVMDMSVLEPRVVYHGTRTEEQFFMFDVSKEKGQGRPYAYFAYNKEYSQNFTEFSQRNHSNSNPFLYECFLNIRKPFMALGHTYEMRKRNVEYWINAMVGTIALDKYNTIEKNAKTKKLEDAVISQIEKYLIDSAGNTDVSFWSFMARDTNADFKYFLISYGYDGIFYGEEYSTSYDPENPKEYTNAVTVFTANDIKLADGKNLNFDPMSADIRYENGGVPEKQAEMEVSPIEQSLSKKERLGNLLFGQKYAKGGAVNTEKQEVIHREKETNNNRKFVDELIKKMKQ